MDSRNVDMFGTFALTLESTGRLYQWNRKKAWNTTDIEIAGWDKSASEAKDKRLKKVNDPSPRGWRMPTREEIQSLSDKSKVSSEWTIQNVVNGRKFTDKESENSLFLPAVGERKSNNGASTMSVKVGIIGAVQVASLLKTIKLIVVCVRMLWTSLVHS